MCFAEFAGLSMAGKYYILCPSKHPKRKLSMFNVRSDSWIDMTVRAADAPALALGQLRDWLFNRRRNDILRTASAELTLADDSDNFREISFTFAVIALAAKLASADGKPSREEFIVFREVFPMPASEHDKIRRLFRMAMRDESKAVDHARRIAVLFPPARHRRLLSDVLSRLFKVATADGGMAKNEEALLREVARCFHIGRRAFERLHRQHMVQTEEIDPYAVLGVKPDWPDVTIRYTYHRLMREYHPDSVQSRGGDADAVLIASRQVSQLNAAYNAICAERRG
jgi:DnaJ like chaperone protein